jgi:transketolase
MTVDLPDIELKRLATLIRISIVKMIAQAKSGHIGGALGLADIYAVLYQKILNVRPFQPDWIDRDYVLVSNGHTCPVWYATLAQQGFFPKTWLSRLRQLDSPLQGHPHFFPAYIDDTGTTQTPVPGVENTSGSLGQGLSQAAGLALGLKKQGRANQVYCLLSDAEHEEGQTWEAYMLARQYQLTNLTPIIDFNQIQISGDTNQIMAVNPLAPKLRAFGWDVWEVDGHNYTELMRVLTHLRTPPRHPTAILAKTIAGKGVSFMENNYLWHGTPPNQDQARSAMAELTAELEALGEAPHV